MIIYDMIIIFVLHPLKQFDSATAQSETLTTSAVPEACRIQSCWMPWKHTRTRDFGPQRQGSTGPKALGRAVLR